ncbi:MAG: SEL1-like repeat protein [Planctomycetaceae bacterium]|nr:SEL1-like repeat protein [Planctomycetaceae bacterium]
MNKIKIKDKDFEIDKTTIRWQLMMKGAAIYDLTEQLKDDADARDEFILFSKHLMRHTAAINGDSESLFTLGNYYLEGLRGIEKDEKLAFNLFFLSAHGAYFPAFVMLARCYANGIGIERDIKEAVYWFELELDYCSYSDLAFLGSLYWDGKEVVQNRQLAITYFVKSADAGHPNKFNLYQFAANEGNLHAQYALSVLYFEGILIPQNIQIAIKLLKKSASQGYPLAELYLGKIYINNHYDIETNPQLAIKLFRSAAEKGNKDAAINLAQCLLDGIGESENIDEAVKIWKKYAKEYNRHFVGSSYYKHVPGDAHCQYMLALVYSDEKLPEYNIKEAIKWLRRSAEQGHRFAQESLGYYLLTGTNVKQNVKEARHFLYKAAIQNLSVAQFYLAEIYSNGQGIQPNQKEAFKWYKKSAEAGFIPAMRMVSNYYLQGVGTAKNEVEGYYFLALVAASGKEEALATLNKLATEGNAAAILALSCYYEQKQTPKLQRKFLEEAANKGLAAAQRKLAARYYDEKNYEQFIKYLRLAADQDDPESLVFLSLEYENGINVTKNLEKSFQLMKRAVDKGHIDANYFLGNFYRDATGTPTNQLKAYECFKKAADAGNSDGIDRLGSFYKYGIVVRPDAKKAFRLFQKAAMLGNPKGECNLGICYLEGIGCENDYDLALKWISRAVKTNHPGVMYQIKSLGLDANDLYAGIQKLQQSRKKYKPEKQFDALLDEIF